MKKYIYSNFKKSLKILNIFINIFYLTQLSFADAPVERMYLRRSHISKEVLQNTNSILNLSTTVDASYIKYENQILNIKNKKFICIPDNIQELLTYKFDDNTFIQSGKLKVNELIPATIGVLSEPHYIRNNDPYMHFLVLDEKEQYIQIFYNIRLNKKVWLKIDDIPKLPSHVKGVFIYEPKIQEIKTYKFVSGKFLDDEPINFENCSPISGIPWTPFSTIRFPIITQKDSFINIVYNATNNFSTWINIDDFQKCYSGNLKGSIIKFEGIHIDIFVLTKSGKRKLYKAPNEKSEFIIIEPLSSIPNYIGRNSDNSFIRWYNSFYIDEIKGEFIKLAGNIIYDKQTDEYKKHEIGWIKIRNSNNELTIWPCVSSR